MKLIDVLQSYGQPRRWTAAQIAQAAIAFLEDADDDGTLQLYLEALGGPMPVTAPAAQMPVQKSLEAYFDRSLSLASMARLVTLPFAGDATGRLVVQLPENLAELMPNASDDSTPGDILGGVRLKTTLGDFAFAICMDTEDIFVDAWLCMDAEKYPDVPTISLPPRKELAGEYVFNLPDGTQLRVGLV